MSSYTLVIADKNYSSWSMRAWLAMKVTGAPFEEVTVTLDRPDTRAKILRYSPSGKVPVLLMAGEPVWDSLAIGETLAERFPGARLWPEDALKRAHARSICAEMHSGFMPLRVKRPMDMKKRETLQPDEEVKACVERIEQLWHEARTKFAHADGDFLYGHFSFADAMYAPVVSRFKTYGFKLSRESERYMDAVWHWPHVEEWYKAAQAETGTR